MDHRIDVSHELPLADPDLRDRISNRLGSTSETNRDFTSSASHVSSYTRSGSEKLFLSSARRAKCSLHAPRLGSDGLDRSRNVILKGPGYLLNIRTGLGRTT